LGRSQSTFSCYSRHVAALSCILEKFLRNLNPSRFMIICFTCRKSQKHLRRPILSILFTDFAFYWEAVLYLLRSGAYANRGGLPWAWPANLAERSWSRYYCLQIIICG
jgi:hypothetical protein